MKAAAAADSLVALAARVALVALGPVLVFPELLPVPIRQSIGVAGAMVAFGLAVFLIRSLPAVAVPLGTLILAAVGGYLRAPDSPSTLSHFTGLGAGVLSMSVLVSWCRTEHSLAAAAACILLSGTGVLMVGAIGTDTPRFKLFDDGGVSRALPSVKLGLPGLESHGYVNQNALAGTALMLVPLAVAMVAAVRARIRSALWMSVLGLLSSAVAGFVMVLMQSRSAWLGVAVTLVVAALRIGRGWLWRSVALAALVLLGGSAAFTASGSWPAETARVLQLTNLAIDARRGIFRQGLDHVRASPLFGIGLNEFRHVYVPRENELGDIAHAHNILLQTALDVGLIGLAAYLCLLCVVLVRADRAVRAGPTSLATLTAAGAGLAIVSTLGFGLGDAIPLGSRVGLLGWLAAGLALSSWRLLQAPRGALNNG